jgi:hypothetical protein
MASKSQVHETLSLFHQREGIPNVMVMDGSKEQLAPWQILTQMPTGWITRQAN